MTTFIAIAGSPKTGITVLKKDGGISRLEAADMAALNWKAAASTKESLGTFAGLTMSMPTTTALALEGSIHYLTSFNVKADWKTIDPVLPPTLRIGGAAGDNAGGYMVLDGEGKPHHVDADTRDWKLLAAPLPFKDQQAALIVGESTGGFLLVSKNDLSSIVRNNADFSGWTPLKPPAPIKIDLITGDFKNGFVAYGEGQLYSLKADKDPIAWAALSTPDFDLVGLAGNATEGIAALVNANAPETEADLVVYCANIGKDPWALALVAASDPAPAPAPAAAPA